MVACRIVGYLHPALAHKPYLPAWRDSMARRQTRIGCRNPNLASMQLRATTSQPTHPSRSSHPGFDAARGACGKRGGGAYRHGG